MINLDHDSVLKELMVALSETRTHFDIEDDKVKIKWCTEFNSRATNLKEFNRGEIRLVSTTEGTKLYFRIILVEHLIIFLLSLAFGIFGLINNGSHVVFLKIAGLILTGNFVFCYFYPLVMFNTFIDGFKKRISINIK